MVAAYVAVTCACCGQACTVVPWVAKRTPKPRCFHCRLNCTVNLPCRYRSNGALPAERRRR